MTDLGCNDWGGYTDLVLDTLEECGMRVDKNGTVQRKCNLNPVVTDKNEPFRVFMHYTDVQAGNDAITVFGEKRDGLSYNYDDRLFGTVWNAGLELAAAQATPKTARYYEIALNHFHQTDDVNLQHVMLGCNRSSGNSYLVFGYTYTRK